MLKVLKVLWFDLNWRKSTNCVPGSPAAVAVVDIMDSRKSIVLHPVYLYTNTFHLATFSLIGPGHKLQPLACNLQIRLKCF